jgi:hypothetical protein
MNKNSETCYDCGEEGAPILLEKEEGYVFLCRECHSDYSAIEE